MRSLTPRLFSAVALGLSLLAAPGLSHAATFQYDFRGAPDSDPTVLGPEEVFTTRFPGPPIRVSGIADFFYPDVPANLVQSNLGLGVLKPSDPPDTPLLQTLSVDSLETLRLEVFGGLGLTNVTLDFALSYANFPGTGVFSVNAYTGPFDAPRLIATQGFDRASADFSVPLVGAFNSQPITSLLISADGGGGFILSGLSARSGPEIIPLPAGFVLLGSGLFGLMLAGRRRRASGV